MGTSPGLHTRVAPSVCQEPFSSHGLAKRSLRSMASMMARHERVENTLLELHPRIAPNIYQEPSSWSGKEFIAKHGFHDSPALSES